MTATYVPVINTQRNVSFGQSVDVSGGIAGIPSPRNQNLLAYTDSPTFIGTGVAGTAGTHYMSALYIPTDFSHATKLYWGNNVAGATPTAGQNFISLYTSAGVQLASVNVDAKVATSGPQTETVDVSGPAGMYWMTFLFNATTMPQLYRTGPLNATLNNLGGSSPQILRSCRQGTGLTTPPVSFDPTTNVAAQPLFFGAIGQA